jgi:proton-translocating NADH-quinone oxidoreductase chain N
MTITYPLLLIALPLAGAPLAYLAGRAARSMFLTRWTARLILLSAWIPWLLVLQAVLSRSSEPTTWVLQGLTLRFDGLSLLISGATLALATFVAFYSGTYMRGEEGEEKYYALLLGMTGSIIGLGAATDLLNLWLWFEAMTVCSLFLVAFYRKEQASLEAGVKYLVQTAVGSALILFGVALMFGTTGTLSLSDLPRLLSHNPHVLPLMASGALFVIGFGVKAALVPLHTWLPDAHAQAPSGISAMLSGVVIESGLVALLRVLFPLAFLSGIWGPVLLAIGALNMLLGNLLALRQTQVKRMLAFSSLSHLGYMLLGIGAAMAFLEPASMAGAFFHLITHMLMKGLAFLCAGALLYALYLSRGQHAHLTISDLNGAASRYPLVAGCFSLALLALAGLPPLAGFMSKWQIFLGAAQTLNPWVIGLVVFAALNSVLSLAYYVPLVNAMYRLEPSDAIRDGKPLGFAISAPLAVMAALVILLGFLPTLVAPLTNSAADVFAALGITSIGMIP